MVVWLGRTVRLKIDWCRSNIIEFDTFDGNATQPPQGLIPSIGTRSDCLFLMLASEIS